MPPRQKTPAPDPVETPTPALDTSSPEALRESLESASGHPIEMQEVTESAADPVPEPAPVEAVDPDAPHVHNYVTDYETLPSCNCRVAFQICDICYVRL